MGRFCVLLKIFVLVINFPKVEPDSFSDTSLTLYTHRKERGGGGGGGRWEDMSGPQCTCVTH